MFFNEATGHWNHETVIRTPETHPDDNTIGRYFADYQGQVHYCTDHEAIGSFAKHWFVRCGHPDNVRDYDGPERKAVTPRQIAQTFFRVEQADGRAWFTDRQGVSTAVDPAILTPPEAASF